MGEDLTTDKGARAFLRSRMVEVSPDERRSAVEIAQTLMETGSTALRTNTEVEFLEPIAEAVDYSVISRGGQTFLPEVEGPERGYFA